MPLLNRKETKIFNEYMLKLNVLDDCDRLDKTKYVTSDVLRILRTLDQNMKGINNIPIDLHRLPDVISEYAEKRDASRDRIIKLTALLTDGVDDISYTSGKSSTDDDTITLLLAELREDFNIE